MDRFLNTFRILEEEAELDAADAARGGEHELDDMEGDAFLPGNNGTRMKTKKEEEDSVLTRWMPPNMKKFFDNASRIKLVIAATIAFLLFLGSISYLNRTYKLPIALPEESLALSVELGRTLAGSAIPGYVLTYAPLVYLDRKEKFFPSDISKHLANTIPELDFKVIEDAPAPLTLENLDLIKGEDVYLSSKDPAIGIPAFLHGTVPNQATLKTDGAKSSTIVVVDKGDGIIDAFYFYFYSFNQGPTALGHIVGNHVGDWEHNMIRFRNGIPENIWYSQHEYGSAYTFSATEKILNRPVSFSARGSHANYAQALKHDFHTYNAIVPAKVVYDYTSPGELWDPSLTAYYYTFDIKTKEFTPVDEDAKTATAKWLGFEGRWGDQQLLKEQAGQEQFKGFWKWVGGPKGPLDKGLDRLDVCLPGDGTGSRECVIKDQL